MPKNNPAAKNKMVTPKVKGSWWNRDMSMLTTLVPLKYLPVDWIDVPGRTQVDVSPQIDIESLPAVSPLYDGWTLETYYYFVPYRLYMPTLRINNVEDVGVLDAEKFPLFSVESHISNAVYLTQGLNVGVSAILPGSVLHRLGYQPSDLVSMNTLRDEDSELYMSDSSDSRVVTLNAIPFYAYLDTWLYGQFNKQDKMIPVEHRFRTYDEGTWSSGISYVDYDVLKQLLPWVGFGRAFGYPTTGSVAIRDGATLNLRFGHLDMNDDEYNPKNCIVPNYPIFDVLNYGANSQEDIKTLVARARSEFYGRVSNTGLLPVTYFGDRFSSWFDAESIAKLEQFSVAGNETLLSLRRENSEMLLNMIAMVSGNDYRSYLKFVYGTELDLCDHPILVGKDSLKFGFMDVLNQSANIDTKEPTTDVNQALAYSAGKARSKNNNVRDINFKTREPGMFMVMAALRPSVRYFEGTDAFLYKREYSELWHPQYSSTGFTSMRYGELNTTLVGVVDNAKSSDSQFYGTLQNRDNVDLPNYVPVGWEYQTGLRKLGGAMVNSGYRTWSLARNFNSLAKRVQLPGYQQLSTELRVVTSSYGNRANFDFNFVDTSDDAQNFIMNFSAKVRCFQPMAKVIVKPSI